MKTKKVQAVAPVTGATKLTRESQTCQAYNIWSKYQACKKDAKKICTMFATAHL